MTWLVRCNHCGKLEDAVVANGYHVKPKTWLQAKMFGGSIIDACSVECATELGKTNQIEDPVPKKEEEKKDESLGGDIKS